MAPSVGNDRLYVFIAEVDAAVRKQGNMPRLSSPKTMELTFMVAAVGFTWRVGLLGFDIVDWSRFAFCYKSIVKILKLLKLRCLVAILFAARRDRSQVLF